jgi:hypothetical protein
MSEPTVPVSETALRKLREAAEWSSLTPAEALEKAIGEYHDRQFWAAVNAGYAALRDDPQAWAEEQAERKLWEATLMDGLDPSERWSEDGTPLPPASEGTPS